MSNKLKKKTSSKEYPKQSSYDRDFKLAKNCYSEVFTSMQLICLTVLYSAEEDGGFDFSEKRMKNFHEFFVKHNQENIDGLLCLDEKEESYKRCGFDCERLAEKFPYRAKIKMYGKPVKSLRDNEIFLASVNAAIESYLILAIYTLRKHYYFTWAMIRYWWESCLDIADLYARGMTDDFVMQFMKDECNLVIVK